MNTAPESALQPPLPLRKVVVVFKTHFDLGFTDLPEKVLSLYTGQMFDAVRRVMEATDMDPPGLRYSWTLPAWPLKYLLHDPAVLEESRLAAHALVAEGRLNWHAWPFTTHTAFCGQEDLVRGLQISRSLSEEFGEWPLAAKQTDVPGHTWIFPSLLVRAGVKFLHLGCNPGSHPPHVPRLFWWEGPDGLRLLTYYSPGGYGTPLLPPAEWELDTWLAVQQTEDNRGPHSPEELVAMRRTIQEGAPDVEVVFGQLGDFAESLLAHPEQLDNLPVVPCDLADTWIHGIGTMPREVSRVRALRGRLFALESALALRDWPRRDNKGDFPASRKAAPLIDAAHEQLMLFGEHTWGLDVKSTIKRVFGPDFTQARLTEPYKRLESSWVAKALYVDRAEALYQQALQTAPEGVQIASRESELQTKLQTPATDHRPLTTDHVIDTGQENAIESSLFRAQVDPSAGGIISLLDKRTGREWVDLDSPEPFGGYRYDIYSASDIAEFMRAYGLFFQDWFVQDFGKAGYPESTPHVTAYARNFKLSKSEQSDSLTLTGGRLQPHLGPLALIPDQAISIKISLGSDPQQPYIDLEYSIVGKEATPLAESAAVPFPMNLPKPTFRLGQVGSVIDPARDIAEGANRNLWCVDGWVDASDDRVGLGVIPVDMPLVSIGNVGVFTFDPTRTPSEPLIYSHLYNTQWGTNFPQWLEGDFGFRTRLVPHAGGWREGQVWRTALQTTRPPRAFGAGATNPPIRASDGLVLLTLRPRHDGDGLIARYWDALGLPRQASLQIDGPVKSVWRCDLMERPVEAIETMSLPDLTFPIAPHAVETFLVQFDS